MLKRYLAFIITLLFSAVLFMPVISCSTTGSPTVITPTNINELPTTNGATPSFIVTYNGNGSTGGFVPVDTNIYIQGQTAIVLGNISNLVKPGFALASWNTASDGSGTSCIIGYGFIVTNNVTLYAVWVSAYSVTYSGNGNSGGTVPSDPNGYTNGQTVTASGNTGILTKTGFAFAGWNSTSTGTGISCFPGSSFAMPGSNITMFAVWAPTHSIAYNGNGNSGGSAPADPNGYTNGQTASVLGNSGGLVKTGSTFAGWTNSAGTLYNPGQNLSMGAVNITLYADWTTGTTYTVTYNGNGNTTGAAPVDGNSYLNGSTVTVLGNTNNLAKTGNAFGGWNTAANGSGTTYYTRINLPGKSCKCNTLCHIDHFFQCNIYGKRQ